MLKLREHLVKVEEDRVRGKRDYAIEEVVSVMNAAIREVTDGKRKL
jgi:hypothetical protein